MEFKELVKKLEETEQENLPEFLQGEEIEVSLDTVKDLAENDTQVSKWLQSEKDSAVTKGIETFKEKTLPDIVEEKVEKRYQEEHPEETEEQKRIRKLEETVTKQKQETQRERLKNVVASKLSENNMSDLNKVTPLLVGQDEDSTLENVNRFVENVQGYAEGQIEATTKELAQKFGTTPEEIKEGESENKGQEGGFEYPSMND